jgi:hypothetical protein
VRTIMLHLCTNDRHGNHIGMCRNITLDDSERLSLESPFFDRHLKCEIGRRTFRLGKMTWQHFGHVRYAGNIMWDAVHVTPETAASVLNFVISKEYQVTVVSDPLIDRLNMKEPITADDLAEFP